MLRAKVLCLRFQTGLVSSWLSHVHSCFVLVLCAMFGLFLNETYTNLTQLSFSSQLPPFIARRIGHQVAYQPSGRFSHPAWAGHLVSSSPCDEECWKLFSSSSFFIMGHLRGLLKFIMIYAFCWGENLLDICFDVYLN